MDPLKAGKGNPHVYSISDNTGEDRLGLIPNRHYISISAVTWFINQSSNWFEDHMASGTMQISVGQGTANQDSEFPVALGVFQLTGEMKVSPVFDRPVVSDRRYKGGSVTIRASLSSITSDTPIATMLRSAARASLSVAQGMVSTASVSGSGAILSAVGGEIITGVNSLLSRDDSDPEPIFGAEAIEKTLHAAELQGPVNYLLFHRGTDLDSEKLAVSPTNNEVNYDGAPLRDGAWLLIQIRRSNEYSGHRDWKDEASIWRGRVGTLVDNVCLDALPKEDGLTQLRPSANEDGNLYDQYLVIRNTINNDMVLTERERQYHQSQLVLRVKAAREAIENGDRLFYFEQLKLLVDSLRDGNLPPENSLARTVVLETASEEFSIDSMRDMHENHNLYSFDLKLV